MKEGFTYVATGNRFKDEANVSVRSLKKQIPGAQVTIFTDKADGLNAAFDSIQIIPAPQFAFYDKIYAFLNSPYEKTVFVDSDTYFCAPVPELFQLLDRFDMAAVRDHWAGDRDYCPLCFDEFNTGLVAYNQNEKTKRVFEDWEKIYRRQIEEKSDVPHDQPAFCSAVYNNPGVSIYVLPKNYNVRLTSPIFLGIGFAPKILHGRSHDFESIKAKLSASNGFQFVMPHGYLVERTSINVIDRNSGFFFLNFVKMGQFLTRISRRARAVLRP